MKDIINTYEIRVWAIRSSGHHAVINWIASLFDPPVVFCNNARPTCTPYFHTPSTYGKELASLYYPTWNIERKNRQIEMLKFYKNCLIYNHENGDFKNWGWHAGEKEIGSSKNQYDILIMRSFRNLLSSWLINPPKKWQKFEKQIVPLYQLYADEYLGHTRYLEFRPVMIWFDLFIKSKVYREQKANLLNQRNEDWTLQYMANFTGRGSHFDSFKDYYDQAHKMKVNERWKQMKDHPKYIELIKKYRNLDIISNTIQKKAKAL